MPDPTQQQPGPQQPATNLRATYDEIRKTLPQVGAKLPADYATFEQGMVSKPENRRVMKQLFLDNGWEGADLPDEDFDAWLLDGVTPKKAPAGSVSGSAAGSAASGTGLPTSSRDFAHMDSYERLPTGDVMLPEGFAGKLEDNAYQIPDGRRAARVPHNDGQPLPNGAAAAKPQGQVTVGEATPGRENVLDYLGTRTPEGLAPLATPEEVAARPFAATDGSPLAGTAAEALNYGKTLEDPSVADDGFWASFGKSLYNGLNPKRIGGNLVNYAGDLVEYLGNNTLYDDYGNRLNEVGDLGKPLTDTKASDQIGREWVTWAEQTDLPLSRAAQQSFLDQPSLASAGNLAGSGVASIVPVGVASAVGGPTAGAAMGAGLGISATMDAARQGGVSDDEALGMATLLAPIQAGLEAFGVSDPGVSKLALRATLREALAAGGGRLTPELLTAASKKVVPELARRFTAGGLRETATEVLQTGAEGEAQVIADELRGNPDAEVGKGRYGTTQGDVLRNAGDAGLAAFGLGGGVGLTHGGRPQQQPAAPATQQAPVAPFASPQPLYNSLPATLPTVSFQQPQPAGLVVPADVTAAEQQAAQQAYPQPVNIVRPTGQRMFQGVQVVGLSSDGTLARIQGQDAQGNPVDTTVPAEFIQQPASAAAPAAAAQPAPTAPTAPLAEQPAPVDAGTTANPTAQPAAPAPAAESSTAGSPAAPLTPAPPAPTGEAAPTAPQGPAPAYASPQQNRQAGRFQEDGQTYERQPVLTPERLVRGQAATAEFATGENGQQQVQYAVMEAADLQPSHAGGTQNLGHFLPDAQPKNRAAAFDQASQQAIGDIATAPDVARLSQAPNAYSGAPVVNQRGEVLQGNGRGEGLRQHYQQGGTSYRQNIFAEAEKVGIPRAAVEGMREPVLVRVADVSDARAVQLGNYSAADTESGGTRRLDARQSAGRMDDDGRASLARLLTPTDGATMTETVHQNSAEVVRLLQKAGLVTPTQLQTMVRRDGTLTPQGVEDVLDLHRQLLFQGADPNLPEIFAELPQAARNGLDRAVSSLVGLPTDSTILPDVQNAVKGLRDWLRSGLTFNNWATQTDAFAADQSSPRERYNPLELELIKLLGTEKRPTFIAQRLDKYADEVRGRAADLFGGTAPKTRAEAVTSVFNVSDNGPRPTDRPTNQSSPADAGRTAAGGPAPSRARAVAEPAADAQALPRAGAANTPGGPGERAGGPVSQSGLATRSVAEQAARQRVADVKARIASRKSKPGNTLNTTLPFLDPEDVADYLDLLGAYIQLGTVKTKELVAALRADGFTAADLSDEQAAELAKQARKDAGVLTKKKRRKLASRYGKATRAGLTQDEKYYTPRTRVANAEDARAYVDEVGLDNAYQYAQTPPGDADGPTLVEVRKEVARRYQERGDQLTRAGKVEDAKAAYQRRLDIIGTTARAATETARTLAQYHQFTADDPDAVVIGAVQETERQKRKALDQAQQDAVKMAGQATKVRREAIQGTLESQSVQQARQQVLDAQPGATGKVQVQPIPDTFGRKNTVFTQAKFDAALRRLRGKTLTPSLDPDLVVVAGYYVEGGARKFADFAKKMIRAVGEGVKPHLPALYAEAQQQYQRAGGNAADFDNAASIEQALRQEQAEALAERIVTKARPLRPAGQLDPIKQLLDTLTAKVAETLPLKATKPKNAAEALAHAFQNRVEYAAVFEQSKELVLERIDALRVSEAVKQQMREDLDAYMQEVIGKPYAERQLARGIQQGIDAIVADLPGATTAAKLDALATLSGGQYAAKVQALREHITADLDGARQADVRELGDLAEEELNRRVLLRRRNLRAQAGIYEEGQAPAPKAPQPKKPMSARVAALLAMRATDAQVAARLAPDAIRTGLRELGVTLDQIARQHAEGVEHFGQTLAERFEREAGLTKQQAQTYADAIQREFAHQVDKKRQALAERALAKTSRLFGGNRTQLEQLTRTLDLSPDATTAMHLLRQRLALPDITVEQAAELQRLSQAVKDAREGKPKQAAVIALGRAVAGLKNVDWFAVPQAMWYANMLSGPWTHVNNFVANTKETLAETMISSAHTWAQTGSVKLALAPVQGLGRGQARAASEAAYILGTGYVDGDAQKFGSSPLLETTTFKGLAAPLNGLKYVQRFLAGADAYANYSLREMRLHELAVKEAFALGVQQNRLNGTGLSNAAIRRQAYAAATETLYRTKARLAEAEQTLEAEGLGKQQVDKLTGKEKAKAVVARNIRLGELLDASRPQAMQQDAADFASIHTFNNDYEGTMGLLSDYIGQTVERLNINGVRPLRFVVPFTRILSNVINRRGEWLGLGYVRAFRGGIGIGGQNYGQYHRAYSVEEQEKAFMRSTLGTLGMLGMYAAAKAGYVLVSGAPTGDKDKDRETPPNSVIYSNGLVTSYKGSVMEANFAVVGELLRMEREGKLDGKSDTDRLAVLAALSTRALLSMGPTENVADFFDAVQGATSGVDKVGRYAKRLVVGAAGNFVPYAAAQRQVLQTLAAITDQTKPEKETDGLVSELHYQLTADLPVYHAGMEDAVDLWGQPMKYSSARVWGWLPERTPVLDAATRLLVQANAMPKRPRFETLALYDPKTGAETPLEGKERGDFMKDRGTFAVTVFAPALLTQKFTAEQIKKGSTEHWQAATEYAKGNAILRRAGEQPLTVEQFLVQRTAVKRALTYYHKQAEAKAKQQTEKK